MHMMFCYKTHQSTKSSIKYRETSLIVREISKAFNIFVVIGTQDFISCRINLIKTPRSYFQNHRFSCVTPVMLIAVVSLWKKRLLLSPDTTKKISSLPENYIYTQQFLNLRWLVVVTSMKRSSVMTFGKCVYILAVSFTSPNN